MANKPDTLYCTFCGKPQHEVKMIIAGPTVFICDECVVKCMDIIEKEHGDFLLAVTGGRTRLLPALKRMLEEIDTLLEETRAELKEFEAAAEARRKEAERYERFHRATGSVLAYFSQEQAKDDERPDVEKTPPSQEIPLAEPANTAEPLKQEPQPVAGSECGGDG